MFFSGMWSTVITWDLRDCRYFAQVLRGRLVHLCGCAVWLVCLFVPRSFEGTSWRQLYSCVLTSVVLHRILFLSDKIRVHDLFVVIWWCLKAQKIKEMSALFRPYNLHSILPPNRYHLFPLTITGNTKWNRRKRLVSDANQVVHIGFI